MNRHFFPIIPPSVHYPCILSQLETEEEKLNYLNLLKAQLLLVQKLIDMFSFKFGNYENHQYYRNLRVWEKQLLIYIEETTEHEITKYYQL